jgi:uncharacterized membrane protein
MNRTTSTLLSIGVSAILIAVGVWFLYNHSFGVWPGHGRWAIGHHAMMGGGMGIVMIIFWMVLIAAVVLLLSGAVNGLRGTKRNSLRSMIPRSLLRGIFNLKKNSTIY